MMWLQVIFYRAAMILHIVMVTFYLKSPGLEFSVGLIFNLLAVLVWWTLADYTRDRGER